MHKPPLQHVPWQTHPVTTTHADDNPAGRVLRFLRTIEAWATQRPNESAMLALMELLEAPQESARIYYAMARLRFQAEAVQTLMVPYEGSRGYASYLRHYDQIIAATKVLQIAHGYNAQQILAGVTDGGWISAEIASETLAEHIAESALSAEQEADYLEQIQAVAKAVAEDESLSPADRTRLIGLLRNVEQALLDIKINGFLPVQEAAAAAGAIVQLTLSEKVQSRTWIKPFYTAVGGLTLILENTANTIAVTEYVQKMIGQ